MNQPYDNTNRGGIWKNERMRPDKQDPEFTGNLNVDGVEYWVSAWKRKPGSNPSAAALSFSIKRKEEKQQQSQGHTDKPANDNDFADDPNIPF